MKPELTQARLKELLHYDPETGHFTWVKSNSNRAPVGKRAGAWGADGYLRVSVDRSDYLAHRLAFLYMTGEFPAEDADHINRVPGDNRWKNLRPASRAQNAANKGLQINNTSGFRGVTWHALAGKWMASVKKNRKKIYLGLFEHIEDAARATQQCRDEVFGSFAGHEKAHSLIGSGLPGVGCSDPNPEQGCYQDENDRGAGCEVGEPDEMFHGFEVLAVGRR